jgi:hypothetical protein
MSNYQPVVIIGAPRSGTNMLRDVLVKLPSIGTWPCDEINYIWRYGNKHHLTDEFSPEMARPKVKNYIRKQFTKIQSKYAYTLLVEKTCANSLRVGFVHEVFPQAKYIFLVRDGRDVVASAMSRWKAPLDIPYVLKKARYLPITDIPYYAVQYFLNHIYQKFSNDKRVSTWGPKFAGMAEILQEKSLSEVCAVQWARCVQKAGISLNSLGSIKYLMLKYEKFVSNPVEELQRISDFLTIKIDSEQIAGSVSSITDANVGKWKTDLDGQIIETIIPHIKHTLAEYGYIRLQ